MRALKGTISSKSNVVVASVFNEFSDEPKPPAASPFPSLSLSELDKELRGLVKECSSGGLGEQHEVMRDGFDDGFGGWKLDDLFSKMGAEYVW
ncbi:hypothetical protein V6N11_062784 [Hibiscus sabdariffa]|uniref:Uncharacterized protein n=1 Tax=Hibiscus sabdariffa TaxID=183260 RepID=A0ABR2PTN7_9ROSI